MSHGESARRTGGIRPRRHPARGRFLAHVHSLTCVFIPSCLDHTRAQVLYIPTYWHHFIVSMGTNIQCNSRSGRHWTKELPYILEGQMKHCAPFSFCTDDSNCAFDTVCQHEGVKIPPDVPGGENLGRCLFQVGEVCGGPSSCATGICAGAAFNGGVDTCRLAAGKSCSLDGQCESNLCRNYICISV